MGIINTRKRLLVGSSEKQPGVWTYDRKSRNKSATINSDMDESEIDEPEVQASPASTAPLLSQTDLHTFYEWDQDCKDNTMMVDSSPGSSPSPSSSTPGRKGAHMFFQPIFADGVRGADPSWIVKKIWKAPNQRSGAPQNTLLSQPDPMQESTLIEEAPAPSLQLPTDLI